MLAHVADGFTAAAVGTGLYAALLWWGSARVPLDPDFTTSDPIYPAEAPTP